LCKTIRDNYDLESQFITKAKVSLGDDYFLKNKNLDYQRSVSEKKIFSIGWI